VNLIKNAKFATIHDFSKHKRYLKEILGISKNKLLLFSLKFKRNSQFVVVNIYIKSYYIEILVNPTILADLEQFNWRSSTRTFTILSKFGFSKFN
jgi:hypothetical protein